MPRVGFVETQEAAIGIVGKLGDTHPTSLSTLYNWALTLDEKGDFSSAVPLYLHELDHAVYPTAEQRLERMKQLSERMRKLGMLQEARDLRARMRIAGAFGGLISASLWILAAKTCASAVVYTSLYTVPSIIVLVGIVLLVAGSVQGGLICCLVGVLLFTLVMWCWARYIPFTIEVAQMVAAAFSENLEMVAISAFGGLLGPIWVILVVVAYAACELKLTGNLSDGEGKESSDAFYPFFFVCVWGSGVIQNICHVAYCGVFSRWYYEEEGAPLLKSLQVALGTSFGSICQGTLIIAAISTVETAVRSSRRQAQQDGNMVGCVISLVLECFLSCIGDLMEYFNQWVFVLCAIRGGTFCDSVKGTCAMISCSGMKAVIGDLLIDRVVMLGSILSAIAGAGLAALAACLAATDAGQQLSKADIIGLCSLLGSLTGLISGSSSDAPLSAPIEVPYQELRQVKAELQRFDEQTQLDVKEFRHRIAEAERELSGLLRSTAEFRKEVDEGEAKWHKHQSYKKACD
eukprot:g32594.t2